MTFFKNTIISRRVMECEPRASPRCPPLLYLCVDDGRHPETLAWPRHGQHGPEEDEDGQDEREEGSGHDVVEDDDKVAQHLRLGHHCVIEGERQLQRPGQRDEKLVRLGDFVTFKHAVKESQRKGLCPMTR